MTKHNLSQNPEEGIRSARNTRWKRAGAAAVALAAVAGLACGTGISGATWNDTHDIAGTAQAGAINLVLDGMPADYAITGFDGQVLGPGGSVTSEEIPVHNAGSVPGTLAGIAHIADGEHATVEVWDAANEEWSTVIDGSPVSTFALTPAATVAMKVRVIAGTEPEAQDRNVAVRLTLVLTADEGTDTPGGDSGSGAEATVLLKDAFNGTPGAAVVSARAATGQPWQAHTESIPVSAVIAEDGTSALFAGSPGDPSVAPGISADLGTLTSVLDEEVRFTPLDDAASLKVFVVGRGTGGQSPTRLEVALHSTVAVPSYQAFDADDLSVGSGGTGFPYGPAGATRPTGTESVARIRYERTTGALSIWLNGARLTPDGGWVIPEAARAILATDSTIAITATQPGGITNILTVNDITIRDGAPN